MLLSITRLEKTCRVRLHQSRVHLLVRRALFLGLMRVWHILAYSINCFATMAASVSTAGLPDMAWAMAASRSHSCAHASRFSLRGLLPARRLCRLGPEAVALALMVTCKRIAEL